MTSLFVSKPAPAIAPHLAFRLCSYPCYLTSKSSSVKRTISFSKTFSFTNITCSAPSVILCRPEYIPNHIPDPKYVRILDTTLRDGEQAAGAAMTGEQKLEIAQQLAKLGVDIIEAGFPAASKDEFEAVKMIAKEVGNNIDETGYVPVICGLARCMVRDIDAAWEAVKYAKRPRVHTFIATSEIHMKYKLQKSREEIIEMARSMVSYARSLGCDDVEFSPEDAARSDREFLYRILGEVIKAGATTLNIPDTVGNTHPRFFGPLIADIKSNTEGIENVIISTHCHNDYGLAVINTEEGMCAGARQVEVTINGIGERGGNAPLEELVMGSKAHGNDVLGGLYTGIITKHILMTSKMVERYSQFKLQPHKPIVGVNAFAHGSGIHQAGMLKNKGTYEIMNPEDIGLFRANESGLVLGKHSGRHAVESHLFELGYSVDGKELDDVFWRFKAVAEKKKCITDDDLIALMDESFQSQAIWTLGDIEVVCGTVGISTAKIKLIAPDKEVHVASSTGTGPVDSAHKAIDLIVKEPVILQEYSLNGVTEGINAIATTRVIIHEDQTRKITPASNLGGATPRTFSGTGASRDVVVSSVRAYLTALNKFLRFQSTTKW